MWPSTEQSLKVFASRTPLLLPGPAADTKFPPNHFFLPVCYITLIFLFSFRFSYLYHPLSILQQQPLLNPFFIYPLETCWKPLLCPLLCAAWQTQLSWGERVRRKMRARGNGRERIKGRREVGGSMAGPIRVTERRTRQWIWHTMPGHIWERAIKNVWRQKGVFLSRQPPPSCVVLASFCISGLDWPAQPVQALLAALSQITSLHCHMQGHQHTSVVYSVVSSFVFVPPLFLFFLSHHTTVWCLCSLITATSKLEV